MKDLKSSLLFQSFLLLVFGITTGSLAFTAGAKRPPSARINPGWVSPESSAHRQYLKGGAFEGLSASDEIVSERTMTSKHFRASDGQETAIISTGSIHYIDAEGLMKDIDIRVMASKTPGYAFENTTNNLRSYFSRRDHGGTGVRVESERGSITIA